MDSALCRDEASGPRSSSAAGFGRRLTKRRARGNDHVRAFFALNSVQKREPFRRNFLIGQNVFDGGELCFGQKERVGQPVEQTLVKQFLRSDIWTQDPECFANFSGDRSDEERLRRFGHVRESDRTRALARTRAIFAQIGSALATTAGRGSLEESSTGNVSPDRGELQWPQTEVF